MKTNWIIMPVHVGTEMTRAAIESCLYQDIPTKIFVVNNGATDGVQNYLSSLDPHRVTVISYMPQKGVSYAWNRALEFCFGEGAEAIMVANNDIVLRPDSYRLLLEDGGEFVTCVGSDDPKCVEPIPTAQLPNDKSWIRTFDMVKGEFYLKANPQAKRPHPDFSCFLLRKSAWGRIGKFDESMVNYCSDGDFHLRLHRAGIQAYCIDLPFYHRASGTLKELPPEERDVILRQAERDRIAFETKWAFRMGSDTYYAEFPGGERPSDPGAARE